MDPVKLAVTILLIALLYAAAQLCIARSRISRFDNLEDNARKVITGSELQAWATNLLAQVKTNANLKISELGTNFPQPLSSLVPRVAPRVIVYQEDGSNGLSFVRLYWGSGFLGAAGFDVGPTNFVSPQPGHEWQPGVYFHYRR